MFRTVRLWWSNGHGKLTARLFIFELVVVVAGVLIAQALAAYVQQRSEVSRMESERSRIRYELISAHSGFRAWQVGVPCLDQKMTEVMAGADFSPNGLRRPRLQTMTYAAPSTEVLDLLADHYGVEEKNRLTLLAENVANSTAVIATIISRWGRLALVDPANGPVSSTDRAEARLAAADIKAQLRAMDVLATDATKVLTRMGIGRRNLNEPSFGPANNCAAIWQSGRLDPPLSIG